MLIWHKHSKTWTANFTDWSCTISPPKADDPLPYYWWEVINKWGDRRSGGCSHLKMAKEACEKAMHEINQKRLAANAQKAAAL